MSPPILHLCNPHTLKRVSPSAVYSAQQWPPRWLWPHMQGRCWAAVPHLHHLKAVRAALKRWQDAECEEGAMLRAEELYRNQCADRFLESRRAGRLTPGRLTAIPFAGDGRFPPDNVSCDQPDVLVRPGSALLCTCRAPDSPRRVHHCHLETFAPEAAAAGWQVLLHGKPWQRALSGAAC